MTDERPAGRRCRYCHASAGETRLQLQDVCAGCQQRIDDRRLYFHVPKPFTLKGVRNQMQGLRCFLRAAALSAAGRTAHAREHGRASSVQRAAGLWIGQWRVLKPKGWRQ